MIKKYIILGFVFILIVFGIGVSIKCSRLEKENLKLKIEQNSIVDSIKIENEVLNNRITHLSEDLEYYKYKVDSLKMVKQKVIVKTEYIVSENLTDGVKKLKDNIKWEQY